MRALGTPITLLALLATTACTHAPRAPTSPADRTARHGVVIMSMHDVEPYEPVTPPTKKSPPAIVIGAPLYGALSGAAVGVVLTTGLTLLRENRWPGNGKTDRDRSEKAVLYGAGLGLAAGTYALVNSLAERAAWHRAHSK